MNFCPGNGAKPNQTRSIKLRADRLTLTLQTANGEKRKRYLYVAIDRCSRSVHLAVKEDETEKSAITFLNEAAAAFPFPLTHVLTDNGSCFTPAFAKLCAAPGA